MQPTLVPVVQEEENAIHWIKQLPQSLIPSTDVMQLTVTRKITMAQVVKTSVTVNNNSPIQDYVHPHDHTQPSYEGSSRRCSESSYQDN